MPWIVEGKTLYCVVLPLKRALSVPPEKTVFTAGEVKVAVTPQKSKLWNGLTGKNIIKEHVAKNSVRKGASLKP